MNEDTVDVQVFNQSGIEILIDESLASQVVQLILLEEDKKANAIEIVYVNEDKIVEINTKHLNKTYITDIITFDYSESEIEGTLYCCAQRIKEQAKELGENEKQEFLRIIIHGMLHLCEYDDKKPEDKKHMTSLENKYLQKIVS